MCLAALIDATHTHSAALIDATYTHSVLLSLMSHTLTAALAAAAAASLPGSRKVSPPSHTQLHNSLRRYVPLIQVTAALEPRALAQLQQQVRNSHRWTRAQDQTA